MKKSKHIIVTLLVVIAAVGASYGAKSTSKLYYYRSVIGNYVPYESEVSCSKFGTGCIVQMPWGAMQQLYIQTSPGIFKAVTLD
ncbi:hypothetical protein [Chitinophaga nivalis]|uniref:Secreted protein n=1 Tax=Chitinophaga nivalis TaxID=2991709 RepID=A0ABT3IQ13_9BACT|nr:hypothetical protein [Chitinophaga nivalis]MCW3464419.1 hypothetical protein [Chitinophaga nivalis]MCW3485890.1 hypothetical protein [Chitinophaga nivalis]